MSRVGTHVTHCCIYHGCSYGDMNGMPCPVASGVIPQEYPCEQCGWAKQEYERAHETIRAGRTWFGDPDTRYID